MIQTRHINLRADIEDDEKIKANAEAANMTVSKFLRNLGLMFTPQIQGLFKKLEPQFPKSPELFNLKTFEELENGNKLIIQKMDHLLNVLEEERIRLKKLFDHLEKQK